jgi:hypothetical protein
MFLQSTNLSIEHLACIDFLDTIIPKNEVTPPMTPFRVTVYGLSFPSCMCYPSVEHLVGTAFFGIFLPNNVLAIQ